MDCSVVIPCHGGADLTRECVHSLLQQRGGPPTEVLLVDNASPDDTGALAALGPPVRVLRQPRNLGFAGGVNAGLRAARASTVLVLNNDTRAADDLLLQLRRALDGDPRLGAVAPVSNHVKGPAQVPVGDRGREVEGRREVVAALAAQTAMQDVDTLAGLCLLLRRSTLAEVGLFDERFGHGNFEDDDLCLRLRLHGYRLGIVRSAFLHHEGHATFRALGLDLAGELARRRAQFVAKWHDDPAGAATIAAAAGDLDAAAAAAREARTRWPLWPDADWHLGRWLQARGEPGRAAVHLRSLLRQCPNQVEARLALGDCLLALGDEPAARREFAAAAAFPWPQWQQRWMLERLGAHAWSTGRAGEAAAQFAAALELSPDDGALHNWLGLCQLAARRLPAALGHFERAVSLGFAPAHGNLGICRFQQGDLAAARASFARACELLPHDAGARANLALVSSIG